MSDVKGREDPTVLKVDWTCEGLRQRSTSLTLTSTAFFSTHGQLWVQTVVSVSMPRDSLVSRAIPSREAEGLDTLRVVPAECNYYAIHTSFPLTKTSMACSCSGLSE